MSQVFISYRHSDTHSPRVADLVKALRAAGVNVVIDSDQLPGGPDEGWPKYGLVHPPTHIVLQQRTSEAHSNVT